jgi:hypothetical protein
MVTASSIGKIIQLGVPLYKNHFWKSFQNPKYTKLVYPWLDCLKLQQAGVVYANGRNYPKLAVDQMPRSMKMKYFPDNPELWYDSMTGMSEEDFMTQNEMQWLDSLSLVLNEEDQIRLSSGIHTPLNAGNSFDKYYFGLDFAGGTVIKDKEKSDFTALSVWRKTSLNVKELVFATEWKGDMSTQLDDILSIIHPTRGLFKCVAGVADYGNMGGGIVDIMIKEGVPMTGLYFHARDPKTGKNFKNSMIEHFTFELRNDRVKYPQGIINKKAGLAMQLDPITKLFKKHFNQWCILEKHMSSSGINAQIAAPDEEKDDGAFSNCLALYAADGKIDIGNSNTAYKIPLGTHSTSMFSGGIGGGAAKSNMSEVQRSIFFGKGHRV